MSHPLLSDAFGKAVYELHKLEKGPMTCKELYERSPEMRAFVAVWIAEKRCPLPFADFLREQGMSEAAVEAATWAATEPDKTNQMGDRHGPFPGQERGNYWWWYCDGSGECNVARFIPMGRIHGHLIKPEQRRRVKTAAYAENTEEAILWLLDNWVPTPPPKPPERSRRGKRRVTRSRPIPGDSPV